MKKFLAVVFLGLGVNPAFGADNIELGNPLVVPSRGNNEELEAIVENLKEINQNLANDENQFAKMRDELNAINRKTANEKILLSIAVLSSISPEDRARLKDLKDQIEVIRGELEASGASQEEINAALEPRYNELENVANAAFQKAIDSIAKDLNTEESLSFHEGE